MKSKENGMSLLTAIPFEWRCVKTEDGRRQWRNSRYFLTFL